VQLRVIGGGDYLETAQALASSLNVSDRVRFEGMAPIEELPRLLREATIGLVPNHASSATHLMLPVKLMEYAAIGVPVIASRLCTVEHYFPDSAVRLVAPGDPYAMANAIEELFRAPVLRRRMVRDAQRIARELGWEHQEARFFEVIDELVNERRCCSGELAQRATHQSEFAEEAAHREVFNAKWM
jgi:glycosyltransferase involved in cell wall biosynthesis